MTTITAPRASTLRRQYADDQKPLPRQSAIVRVPRIAAWGTLMVVGEAVRFAGFMVLLVAMGVEAGANGVLNPEREE